ncbi:hypothetical protein DUI87_26837 [Hirundo rustica rustica]|uniref:Chemokine interleukin-8-like domain-containing protein n=1 Tax=Hirundo rustica rustica TaxID=333673 RepID=A0A3M0J5Y1_HIRRU|nr:hypothetical protein DUI87_26837 [Hirundo rustica rustica]
MCLASAEGVKCKCSRKGPKIRFSNVRKLEIKPRYPFCVEEMIIVTLWTRVRGEQQHCLNPKRQNTIRLLKWYRRLSLLPCALQQAQEPCGCHSSGVALASCPQTHHFRNRIRETKPAQSSSAPFLGQQFPVKYHFSPARTSLPSAASPVRSGQEKRMKGNTDFG